MTGMVCMTTNYEMTWMTKMIGMTGMIWMTGMTYMIGMNRITNNEITGMTNAVFRLERFTEVREFTYLGKHFPCVNAN